MIISHIGYACTFNVMSSCRHFKIIWKYFHCMIIVCYKNNNKSAKKIDAQASKALKTSYFVLKVIAVASITMSILQKIMQCVLTLSNPAFSVIHQDPAQRPGYLKSRLTSTD